MHACIPAAVGVIAACMSVFHFTMVVPKDRLVLSTLRTALRRNARMADLIRLSNRLPETVTHNTEYVLRISDTRD